MKRLLTSIFVCSVFGFTTNAQSNDCATAPAIIQGTTCTGTTGTTAGATQSMAACSGTAEDDVWYKFVATSTVANIYAIGDGDFDMVFQVFSGTCGSLTSLGCVDNTYEGEEESQAFSGLTIGQTYYVRFHDYYNSPPSALTFSVCITAPCGTLTQPAGSIVESEACNANSNGGCLATPTAVYQDITCGDVIWGSTWANAGSRDTDWYRFTVTTATQVSWTVAAELPVALLFVDISDCSNPAVLASDLTDGCSPTTLTYSFTPGTYVAFVAPEGFYGYPCGTYNDYSATLTMTTTAPVISAGGATTFCSGGSVNLTSTGTGSFAWQESSTPIGGATTSSYSATTTGNYSVKLTDANGCKSTSNTIAVTVNPIPATPTITPSGATTFCAGGSVTLTSSSATGNVWSTGETTQAITVNASGTYNVAVTTAGCTSMTSSDQTVTVNPADDASFSYSSSTLCSGGANETPTAAMAGTFSSTSGLNFADASTGEIDMSTSADGTYTITHTTAGTCPATATQSVTITAAPDASFSYAQASYCALDTDPSVVFGSGASGGAFSASTGLLLNSGTGVIDLSGSMAGTYTVTNTIAAAGACPMVTATFDVTVVGSTTTTVASGGTFCAGDAIPALPATSTNSITGTWSPAIDNMNTATYTFTPDAGQCATTATTTITVNPIVAPAFAAGGTYCSGASVPNLPTTSTNSITGTWSPAIDNMNTTTYTFTPDGGQCASTATTTITVNPTVAPTFAAGGTYCAGATIPALPTTSTNSVAGTWSPAINNTATTTYTFTPNSGQCASTATSTITVNQLPTVTFGPVAQLCVYNSPVTLSQGAPAGGTYTGTGVTGTQFNPATAGLGTATLTYSYTDANGCTNTANSSVVVDACLGIEEVADMDVTIAPNPATESFVITSNGVDNLSYTVVANDGRLVVASKNITNGVAETVNVQGFARGIYFVKLSSGTQTTTKKIIVE